MYIAYMFQCFTETKCMPWVFAGFLCNICRNISADHLKCLQRKLSHVMRKSAFGVVL